MRTNPTFALSSGVAVHKTNIPPTRAKQLLKTGSHRYLQSQQMLIPCFERIKK